MVSLHSLSTRSSSKRGFRNVSLCGVHASTLLPTVVRIHLAITMYGRVAPCRSINPWISEIVSQVGMFGEAALFIQASVTNLV